jgi:hypothetical protein
VLCPSSEIHLLDVDVWPMEQDGSDMEPPDGASTPMNFSEFPSEIFNFDTYDGASGPSDTAIRLIR